VRDLEGALADFAAAGFVSEAQVGRGDHSYIHVSAVFWLQGHRRLALGLARYATEEMLKSRFKYSDAAGGVQGGAMLWFYATQLGDEDGVQLAEKLMTKLLKGRASRSWPAPIASFVLGEISESAMMNAVSEAPILRDRQLAQANFYAAARRLVRRDVAGSKELFRAALQSRNALIEIEYFLAQHELEPHGPAA
jgi:lipoprotein NlpI